jgi:hypothetical protein
MIKLLGTHYQKKFLKKRAKQASPAAFFGRIFKRMNFERSDSDEKARREY